MIVRLALLGGDAGSTSELRDALAALPGIALLAPAHAADADVLLAADSSHAAAGDLVRGERSRRAGARVLLVAPAGSAASPRAGARLWRGRGRRATARRARRCARRWRQQGASMRVPRRHGGVDEGHIALARRRRRHGHDDLRGGAGSGARARLRARPGARDSAMRPRWRRREVVVPDALLRMACGPVTTPAELAAGLAHGDACRVLAGTRAAGARRPDRRARHRARARSGRRRAGCARSSTAAPASASRRFPVLERAGLVAIVASADARGVRGARRTSLLLARLGLSGRPLGIVATQARHARAARSLATEAGLPLLAVVRPDTRVPRARERGLPPPEAAFAALAELAARRMSLWERAQLGAAAAVEEPGGLGRCHRPARSAGGTAERSEHHRGDRERAGRGLDRAPGPAAARGAALRRCRRAARRLRAPGGPRRPPARRCAADGRRAPRRRLAAQRRAAAARTGRAAADAAPLRAASVHARRAGRARLALRDRCRVCSTPACARASRS